jgi:hypothetical protein
MRIRNDTAPKRDNKNYYSNPAYYKEFKKKFPQYSGSTFLAVVSDFNSMLREEIIEQGFEWNVFSHLGKIAVYKYRPKITKRPDGRLSLPINVRETAKLWEAKPELRKKKYVYHMNEHSDGYMCKIFWTKFKENMRVRNQHFVNFAPVVRFSKAVRAAILEKRSHENYFIYEAFNNK